jgi:hypothetical protein
MQTKIICLCQKYAIDFLACGRGVLFMSGCVAMQARKKPGQVHPEQGYYYKGKAGNCPDAVKTRIFFTKHIAEMKISNINQP